MYGFSKITIVFTLFWTFFSTSAYAQADPFTLIFGDSATTDKAVCVQQSSDGSIFVLGISGETNSSSQLELFKLDENGHKIWSKKLTDSDYNYPNGMLLINDETRLVIVYETHGASVIDVNSSILCVDTAGYEVWRSKYGNGARTEVFSHIIETSTGDFLVTGFVTDEDTGGAGNDFLAVWYDSRGNYKREGIYGGLTNDVASSSVELAPDQFYIFGDNLRDSLGYQVYGVKVDSFGTELDSYFANFPYNSGCKKSCKSVTGDIYVIGESGTATSAAFDVYLTKFNPKGEFVWQKLIPATDKGDAGLDITEIQPTNLLITGYGFNDSTNSTDLLALLVDSSGTEIRKNYYYFGDLVDLGLNVIPSVNGGFIIGGTGIVDGSNEYVVVYDTMPGLMYQGLNNFTEVEKGFVVFPNPGKGKIEIKGVEAHSEIVILNLQGEIVGKTTTDSYGNGDLTLQKPGLYFIKDTKSGNVRRLIVR